MKMNDLKQIVFGCLATFIFLVGISQLSFAVGYTLCSSCNAQCTTAFYDASKKTCKSIYPGALCSSIEFCNGCNCVPYYNPNNPSDGNPCECARTTSP